MYKIISHKHIITLVLILTLGIPMTEPSAQTPPEAPENEDGQPPKSAETIALEAEIALLKLEADKKAQEQKIEEADIAIAEAKRKKFTDQLPATDTKGKEGAITISEGAGYYSKVLALNSMQEATKSIVEDLIGPEKNNAFPDNKLTGDYVFIVSGMDISDLAGKWSVLNARVEANMGLLSDNLTYLGDDEKSFVDKGDEGVPLAALAAAPAILGGISDLTKFFRTDSSISNVDVTANESAFQIALIKALKTKNEALKIYKPSLAIAGDSYLENQYHALVTYRNKLQQRLDETLAEFDIQIETETREKAEIEKELKAYKATIKDKNPTPVQEEAIGELEFKITQKAAKIDKITKHKTRTKTQIDAIILSAKTISDFMTTKDGDVESPLTILRSFDLLKTKLDAQTNPRLINASVTQVGGEYLIQKGSFVRDKVSYLGGATVQYELFDMNGIYHAAGLFTDFQHAKTEYREGYDLLTSGK